jgi:hypothetical protein
MMSMHILSARYRSEFLAVPQLVRFTMAEGRDGSEATLLIKSSTLTLKYLLRLKRFKLFVFRIDQEWIAYAVQIDDDPNHPATLWSILEYDDEVSALQTLIKNPKCFVFLFNELAVNVAWGEVDIDLSNEASRGLIESAKLHPADEVTASMKVGDLIDEVHGGQLLPNECYATEPLETSEWHPIESHYITNSISTSLLSIFETDEGRQQEEAALWLIDSLHATGAVMRPQIQEGTRSRELSDLLLSYEHGYFLIESKSLSIFARESLPNRDKLARDITKHLQKATSQLQGSVKNLRRGHPIMDLKEQEIKVEKSKAPHVIVLVPDLTLLSDATEFGGDFIQRASLECGGFFHILDPSELLRVVQASEMISAKKPTMTKMMAFDYYLLRRAERAITHKTPNFGVLFRDSNPANMGMSGGE